MAEDFGTGAATYAPDFLSTGLIGKIAKQVVENETIPYLFASLDKGAVKYGKDIEIELIKAASGRTPIPTSPSFDQTRAEALYFKTWTPRVYATQIDYDAIDDGAQSEANAQAQAAKIIDSLYQGASKDKNQFSIDAIVAAIATAGTASKKILKLGDAAEIVDEATANAYLLDVKNAAKKVRRGSPSVNPSGLDVPADRVVMIAPASNVTRIDVYKRTNTEQLDYARFDVDEVIEYDADKYGELNGATIIADERYFQFHEKARKYRERELIGAANGGVVNIALNTRDMYALCPLFNAVVFGQS